MSDYIEYCVDNVPDDVRARLPDDARARPCLQWCGHCYEGPLLAVNGELRTGESYAELLGEEQG